MQILININFAILQHYEKYITAPVINGISGQFNVDEPKHLQRHSLIQYLKKKKNDILKSRKHFKVWKIDIFGEIKVV